MHVSRVCRVYRHTVHVSCVCTGTLCACLYRHTVHVPRVCTGTLFTCLYRHTVHVSVQAHCAHVTCLYSVQAHCARATCPPRCFYSVSKMDRNFLRSPRTLLCSASTRIITPQPERGGTECTSVLDMELTCDIVIGV